MASLITSFFNHLTLVSPKGERANGMLLEMPLRYFLHIKTNLIAKHSNFDCIKVSIARFLNPTSAIEGAELHRMESGFGNQNQIPRYY